MGRTTQLTIRRSAIESAFALLIAASLTACVASDENSSAATTAASVAEFEQPAATVAAAATAAGGDVSLAAEAAAPPTQSEAPSSGDALPAGSPFGTALAIKAQVTIEVVDVRETVLALPRLIDDQGGAIFDTEIVVGDAETASASVTVKVPPTDLEPLISGLDGLGELTGRSQQTEDVADQIADTGARIQTAQASVDRVRALLDDAATLNDVVRIESELTIRETALERLLATQRNLTDRVQLATLTIIITAAPQQEAVAVSGFGSTGVGDALGTGWNAFTDVLHAGALGLAYIAPFLVLTLVAGLLWLLFRRHSLHSSPVPGGVTEPNP